MHILTLFSKNFCSNTYLLTSDAHCAIIDPGLDDKIITDAIEKHKLVPQMILLTHGHFDHIFSVDRLRKIYSIPVMIHSLDAEMLTDSYKNAYSFFFSDSFIQRPADNTFADGDKIRIGDEFIDVIHTPGHSKGSSCFSNGKVLITGDTLFANGIGRTDLYGGNSATIYKSLDMLRETEDADEISIYPGHGPGGFLSTCLENVIY